MNSNEDYGIVKFPLITEKSIRLNERENKIIFIVDKKSNKNDIKNAVERIFNVRVVKINTTILQNGRKKAFVRLANENPARDIITTKTKQ